MISPKIKAYFREALVSRLTFNQIQNLMEQAGLNRIYGAGQNYFKGKPSKTSLVDEYFQGAVGDINGDEKISEAIKSFLLRYKETNPSIEIENLIKELKGLDKSSLEEQIPSVRPINFNDPDTHIVSTPAEKTKELRDIFLCHASKDKNDYIIPFLDKLHEEGITYWYDEAEIKWGDSLIKKINEGIKKSKFILVFLTKNFVDRNWTEKEMNAALSIEVNSGATKVLPLLIGSKDETTSIFDKYPLLNDKKFKLWEEGISSIIDALKERLIAHDDKYLSEGKPGTTPQSTSLKKSNNRTVSDSQHSIATDIGADKAYKIWEDFSEYARSRNNKLIAKYSKIAIESAIGYCAKRFNDTIGFKEMKKKVDQLENIEENSRQIRPSLNPLRKYWKIKIGALFTLAALMLAGIVYLEGHTPKLEIVDAKFSQYDIYDENNILKTIKAGINITIANKSNAWANDVIVNFINDIGASKIEKVGYFRKNNRILEPFSIQPNGYTEQGWLPEIPLDAINAYKSKEKVYYVDIFIDWKNAWGWKYSSVARYKSIADKFAKQLQFEKIYCYDTFTNKKKVQEIKEASKDYLPKDMQK